MISINNFSFTYPEQSRPAVKDISLTIEKGAFALLVGESGAGKSTILRCLNGLVPHFSGGEMSGELTVNGIDPVKATPKVMSQHVGFVFQDPETQFIVDRVEDEIAFTLENLGMEPEKMRSRVEFVLELLELKPNRLRRIDSLSGGEQQRVAIATALALQPRILVLDEPTSQLDPESARQVLEAVTRLNKQHGLTIIISEHRIERIIHFVDTLIFLQPNTPGVIIGRPQEVLSKTDLLPPSARLGKFFNISPLPLTAEDGKSLFHDHEIQKTERTVKKLSEKDPKPPFIEVEDLVVDLGSKTIINHVGLTLHKTEILVLMGPNGSGKTTLLRAIIGLLKIKSGEIKIHGESTNGLSVAQICRQAAYLPQNPNSLLFSESVADELMVSINNRHPSMDEQALLSAQSHVQQTLVRTGLEGYSEMYPRDLSVGQRQRVAIGAVTITSPRILLMDEPTRGLDNTAKQSLANLLVEWRDAGMGILLVTHDVELAASIADRVALLENGVISACGDPSQVLRSSPVFTPQIAVLFPQTQWLTVEDAIYGLGRK